MNGAASRRAQAGMTLVELMIAMVLGLVLVGGAIQVLLSTQESYRLQENMARLQENARFAMEMVARDLRMAGYSHCGTIDNISFHNNVADPDGDPDPAFDFGNAATIRDVAPQGALAGSDALRLRHAQERSLRVQTVPGGGSANLKVGGNVLHLRQGDVVTVTDCSEADTFRITNTPAETEDESDQVTLAHAANFNVSPHLQGSYAAGDRVVVIRNLTWFIAEDDDLHADGTPVPVLYRDAGDGPEAVVEDVRAMRIRYGTDDDGDGSAERYLRAAAVTDWRRVVSVRVSLLLQTAENGLSPTAQSVVFDNAEVTSDDRRVLRAFTTTVSLRNHSGGVL
ncbi:PilW family protein [Algiphilus sp.]|uniref:PilW family protein n=1 Tax=Algiphilus sp. TaxID=1872431 RepID=UPI003C62E633